ncbi:MAG: YtxH domain-containing protein [Acidobacteria bacterium]|jgi:gas vesicle protein|nr:YtxH domain-containing protein [Acidobacteriota bacterium]
MSEQSSGFSWFLAGLGIGALIGVLYAPKSGRETREELLSSARDGSEYLKARGREAATQMNTYAERGRERVNEYVDRGRTQWDDFVRQGRDFVQEKSNKVSAAVQAGKEAYETAAGREAPQAGPQAVEASEGQA